MMGYLQSIFILVFCFSLFIAPPLSAEKAAQLQSVRQVHLPTSSIGATQSKPSQPYKYIFGVYPVGLWDFDFAKKTFKISFYAWWRTQDPAYHPEKSVEITNATEYSSKFGKSGKNKDEYFTYIHYYATIQKSWDFKFFPFDHQFLEVRLEDFADINSVEFEPDYDKSHLHNELILPGWEVRDLILKKSVTHYATNFGDISTKDGYYSRLSFLIEIKRQGWQPLFNYFIGFFIAFCLCAMIFFVEITNLNARASLSLGGIFTAVGNKYILDQVIPLTNSFSLADAFQIATFSIILLSVFSIIFINWKLTHKGQVFAWWYNNLFCTVLILSYTSFVGTWIFRAILS
jgi:hypothetical protein